MFGNLKCKKCGKAIDSIINHYGSKWICSECAEDKESVLYCERGCKVKAVHLNYGYDWNIEKAHQFLQQDKIYEVESVEIGKYISYVCLKEIPNQKFNTVQFVRCQKGKVRI